MTLDKHQESLETLFQLPEMKYKQIFKYRAGGVGGVGCHNTVSSLLQVVVAKGGLHTPLLEIPQKASDLPSSQAEPQTATYTFKAPHLSFQPSYSFLFPLYNWKERQTWKQEKATCGSVPKGA